MQGVGKFIIPLLLHIKDFHLAPCPKYAVRTDVGDGRIGEPVIMKVDPSMMLSMIDHMLGSTSDDGDDSVTSYTYTDIELPRK